MKMVSGIVLFASLSFVTIASADISTTSPYEIGFYCPPYTETFVEGGYYTMATTSDYCIWQTGNLPGNPHYGGFFRGIVGSSTGSGNFMSLATEKEMVRNAISDPQQGEPFFAAVWEQRLGPAFNDDLILFRNFFRDGSNPPPSNGWGVINWKWGEVPLQECCSNAVFIPGIKGSVLKTGSDTLWPPTVWSDDVAQLALNEFGESVNDIYVDGVLETFYGTPIYAPFLNFMDDLVVDGVISEWQSLPYDWRFSPETILEDGIKTPSGIIDIVEEIEVRAAQSQTGQITIVAHSMGGLMGKAIIKKLEEEGKENLIDSFVMVGVPQLGTPQAAAAILHGDDEGIVAGLIVSQIEARAISQNMPSTYNLLPSPRYFGEVTDPIITFDSDSSFTQEWRDFWGLTINNYFDFSSFAIGEGVARAKPPKNLLRVPEVLRADLMINAEDLHNEYDNYTFPEHIRVVQVAGWGRPTTKTIEYRDNHSLPSYRTLFTTEGDKTVVYPSAISSATDETYFVNLSLFNKNESQRAQHRDLLNTTPVQNIVSDVIKENSILGINYVSEIKPPLTEVDAQLIISTHSPILLGAYDELGNFTGIDPSQDLSAEILFITEDIPGSTFLYTSDSQHIFLPKSGIYRFVYKGVGEGPTTVEIESFIADSTTTIVIYSDIPTTQNTTATFTVDSVTPEIAFIELDLDGDEVIDAEILADGMALSIDELIALLKEKIQALDVKKGLKKKLLKKVDKLEKKLEKKKKNSAKVLYKIKKEIRKLEKKGKMSYEDAQELLDILEQIESAL